MSRTGPKARSMSHRPLSMRLRIWHRRPSHSLKSPTTETQRAWGAQTANTPPPAPSCTGICAARAFMDRDLCAQPLVELPVVALDEQVIVHRTQRRTKGVGVLIG